jgi:hypothetical protein
MKRFLGWLLASFILVLASSYAWTLRRHVVEVVAARGDSAAPVQVQTLPNYAEVRQAQEMVTVTGPMADYMLRQKSSHVETLPPVSHRATTSNPVSRSPVGTSSLQPISGRATPSDHVGESPVGASSAVLHKTFAVTDIVSLPIEVPAHASNPRLRGTYRAFLKRHGTLSTDTADVEFFLLNEKQYADFLSGHSGEAMFSADAAQEVAAGLPPTLGEPAKYHLVFRNNSGDAGKKIVQADFQIDF